MNRHKKEEGAAHKVALMGLLFAAALSLSFLEDMLPVLPMLPPGFKLGLSNIITMYTLMILGSRQGWIMVFLKSGFVLITRGAVAGGMSLTGGVVSVMVMLLILRVLRDRKDYLILSIFGAAAHNIGQILLAATLLGTTLVFTYLPVVLLTGIIMGLITGKIFQIIFPHINRIFLH